MQIIDRYTGKILNDSNLPGDIELGRYAISMGSSYRELTSKSYKVQEGQRIHQELLDDVNKDKHNIFEIISESVEKGDFRSIPLLQGIKNGLEFGDFATQMEEDFKHIEAPVRESATRKTFASFYRVKPGSYVITRTEHKVTKK